MAEGFNKYQKSMGLVLMLCAFMVVPLSAGLVFLSQYSRADKQISAAPAVVGKCDLTGDSKVDTQDYDLAILAFGRVSPDAGNGKADIDSDGWVNSLDLDAIQNNSSICSK